MIKPMRLLPLVAVLIAAMPASAQASGRLIFAKGEVFIVASDGARRPAHQGDLVNAGERLVTGGESMAQLKLEDGSLVGLRPGSDLQLRSFARGGSDPGTVLMLDKGGVRVLNITTDDKLRPLPVRLQSSSGASVLVQGGDLESRKTAAIGAGAPMIARLNAGAALVRTDQGERPLPTLRPESLTATEVKSAPLSALPPVLGLSPKADADAGSSPASATRAIAADVVRTPVPPAPIPVPYPNLATAPVVAKNDLFLNPGIITAPSVAPVLRPTVGPITSIGASSGAVQLLTPVVQPTIIVSTTPLPIAPSTGGGTALISGTTTTTTSTIGTLQIGGSKTTIVAPLTSKLLFH